MKTCDDSALEYVISLPRTQGYYAYAFRTMSVDLRSFGFKEELGTCDKHFTILSPDHANYFSKRERATVLMPGAGYPGWIIFNSYIYTVLHTIQFHRVLVQPRRTPCIMQTRIKTACTPADERQSERQEKVNLQYLWTLL
jgi:hypothetical protein